MLFGTTPIMWKPWEKNVYMNTFCDKIVRSILLVLLWCEIQYTDSLMSVISSVMNNSDTVQSVSQKF